MGMVSVFAIVATISGVPRETLAATLSLGHNQPIGAEWDQIAKRFAEEVSKNSKGELKVEVFPAESLGKSREMIEGTMMGTQQLFMDAASMFEAVFEPISVFALPFLFRNDEHLLGVGNGPVGKEIFEEMRKKTGLRVIGVYLFAPRQLTTKVSITKPEQVKGLKIRVPEIPIFVSTWKALGARPTPISASELYTSLATGIVDAQENPFSVIFAFKLYEVLKYCNLTSHVQMPGILVMNDKFFSGLSAPMQEIIMRSGSEAMKWGNELVTRNQNELKGKLSDKGMLFTNPDRKAFAEATQDVYEEFIKKGKFTRNTVEKIKKYGNYSPS
jgi:tripartite ATP-independent transporter DctP family solute receptor